MSHGNGQGDIHIGLIGRCNGCHLTGISLYNYEFVTCAWLVQVLYIALDFKSEENPPPSPKNDYRCVSVCVSLTIKQLYFSLEINNVLRTCKDRGDTFVYSIASYYYNNVYDWQITLNIDSYDYFSSSFIRL